MVVSNRRGERLSPRAFDTLLLFWHFFLCLFGGGYAYLFIKIGRAFYSRSSFSFAFFFLSFCFGFFRLILTLVFSLLCVFVYYVSTCTCVFVCMFHDSLCFQWVWLLLVQARIRCRASRRLPAYRASDFVFFHVALLFVPDNDPLVHGRLV